MDIFKLALSKEALALATFLLPLGRYRYLRAPMGLSSSSDEWCCHSDCVIKGLPWTKKIVDDILIWAPDIKNLETRLSAVLDRCAKINVTISRPKFEIGDRLNFAGFIVAHDGVRPDPKHMDALSKFPMATSQTKVQSFWGLADQLASF